MAGIRVLVLDLTVAARVSILINAFIQILVVIVLSGPSAVRAYFDRQDQVASLNISGT